MNRKNRTIYLSAIILFSIFFINSFYPAVSSSSNSFDWFNDDQVSGLIDLNKPDKDFDVIASGNTSDNWNFNVERQDNDEMINDISIFSSWKNEDPQTDILVASNIKVNYTQDVLGFNIFSVNSSLLAPLMFFNININDTLNILFNFQHLGFRIYSEEDSRYYNGVTIIPDIIRDKIKTGLLTGLKDPQVSYSISNEKLTVSYKNLIIFWQNSPQKLDIGDQFSSIMPFIDGLAIKFITVFDSISFEYKIINNHESTNIVNKIHFGALSQLVINESLPEISGGWLYSSEISPPIIDLKLHPLLDDVIIDFPTLSIYNGRDIVKRINLENNQLKLDVLNNIWSYYDDNDQNFILNKYIGDGILTTGDSKQEIESGIKYKLESDKKSQTIDLLVYDVENYNLGTKNNQIFELTSYIINTDTLSDNYKTVQSQYLQMYKNFFHNFSISKNFSIPDNFYTPIQNDELIQTNLSFWDGSEMEFYLGFMISSKIIADENTSSIETANFHFYSFSLFFLIIGVRIKRNKKKNNKL